MENENTSQSENNLEETTSCEVVKCENPEVILKDTSLTPKEIKPISKEPIDIEIIEKYRGLNIFSESMFNEGMCSIILAALEKGASLEMTACYAGISPLTLKTWIDEGLADAEKYTKEDLDNGILLSDKGQFAIKCMQSLGKSSVTMANELYDRCFETGNTHLMIWYLERLDPQKYHLKKKIAQDINQNINTNSVVEFKFTDGLAQRPQEDQVYIDDRLKQLNEQYKGGQ